MQSQQDERSASLERLLIRFGNSLRGVAYRYGLSERDADELCQEVRIRLWRALESSEKISAVSASYVRRTALSAAVDLLRRRRALREQPLERNADLEESCRPEAVTMPVAETVLEEQEFTARIGAAVAALSTPRDVVVRLYLAGYDRHEIADMLEWSEPKTRNLIYRGLDDLRARLTKMGIGPGREK